MSINSNAEVLEQYIRKHGNNIEVSAEDLCSYITDILWGLIYELGNICKSFGIDILTIQSRSKYCRLPLAEFIGIPIFNSCIAIYHQQETDKDTLEAYINKDAQKVLNAIDAELKNCKKPQGKRIALIICALEQYAYISNIDGNIERIYEAFKLQYPDKIATRQAVTQYINAHRNSNAKTDKPQFTNEELTSFIDKI